MTVVLAAQCHWDCLWSGPVASTVIAVVGATATGKSDFGLALAAALAGAGRNAEIVNADAMQLYRGMDIGTAKLPLAARRGIPHHQIDVLDPTEETSVAAYQTAARADVAAILERNSIPIVVGGSGLYLRALLDELEFPATDPAVRAQLEARGEREGYRALHDELLERDPVAGATINPANKRRVVRALEVMELTGMPFSASMPSGRYHFPNTVQFGLKPNLDWLDARIAARTEAMLAAGLIAEVQSLGKLGATAARATGYAEVVAYLEGRLEGGLTEAIALATRQLARRQIKWFRPDQRIKWLPAAEPEVGLSEARALINWGEQ